MAFISQAYLDNMRNDEQRQFTQMNMLLGYQPETHDKFFISDSERYASMNVIGVRGVGKSRLLENLIFHDSRVGNAVIVIDSQGDLTTHCLGQLPIQQLAQTYLLDMEDEDYPFGVNILAVGKLETSVAQAQTVDRLMCIFEALWADILSQQQLSRYVRLATITLLANPGATLLDMYNFLVDAQIRSKMLQNVTDTTVLNFWQFQYEDLPGVERTNRIQPLINRLETLFVGRSLVSNIIGQRETTIDFRQAIENKELLFIKLPMKTISQDAQLVGTIIIAQIHAVLLSFVAIPESQRPGVSIYVDEFQDFTLPNFSELFTEGRKFGVKLTVAYRCRNQLPAHLQNLVLTARTNVCFQETPEDAREVAHLFPAQEGEIRLEDIDPHPVSYLLSYGSDDLFVKCFIETYLLPLQSQRRDGRVDIEGQQLTFDLWNGAKMRNVYVLDPTPYLDNLLHEVMKAGNYELRMPVEVVQGFANCGRGFFSQVRGLSPNDVSLSIAGKYPPALVVRTPDGGFRWTRPPESAMEQFFHFVFYLRMTMLYLAENPIGRKGPPSTTAVAQMLTQLPPRAAFVQSGEDIGVIYTNHTPQQVDQLEYQERLKMVQEQTRQKYCHQRIK